MLCTFPNLYTEPTCAFFLPPQPRPDFDRQIHALGQRPDSPINSKSLVRQPLALLPQPVHSHDKRLNKLILF